MISAIGSSVPVIHAGCVLFGAPLLADFPTTLGFALLQTLFLTPIIHKEGKSLAHLKYYTQTSKQYALGLVVALLISSIVVPLDWNRWWQKWPLPQTFASCLYVMGYILKSLILSGRVENSK